MEQAAVASVGYLNNGRGDWVFRDKIDWMDRTVEWIEDLPAEQRSAEARKLMAVLGEYTDPGDAASNPELL